MFTCNYYFRNYLYMSFLIDKLKKAVSEYLTNPAPNDEIKEQEMDLELEEQEQKLEYEITDNEYKYIDEDDLLQKFGLDRDLTKTYNLNVCLYKMNKSLEKPFIEYYFEKKGGEFTFINTELTPVLFENIEDETNNDNHLEEDDNEPSENNIVDIRDDKITGGDRISDIEEIYLKNCNEIIDSHIKDITRKYKGFVELDNLIYPIFEITDDREIELITGSKFSVLDEIINKKKIIDTPIQEKIITVFNENPELLKIKDSGGKELANPISVYLCKKNGVIYENVYVDDESNGDIDMQIHHDTFGDVYLFTTEPINTVGSFFSFFTGAKQVKRYALFLENETTINNDNKGVADFLKEASDSLTGYLTYTCISYTEAGRQFWAVKSKTLFTEI